MRHEEGHEKQWQLTVSFDAMVSTRHHAVGFGAGPPRYRQMLVRANLDIEVQAPSAAGAQLLVAEQIEHYSASELLEKCRLFSIARHEIPAPSDIEAIRPVRTEQFRVLDIQPV